jgi:trehalose synthase
MHIAARAPDRFDSMIGPARARQFADVLSRSRRQLDGKTLWHLSSTAKGGGVAEILSTVLSYLLGAGIETRWLVIAGNEDFFEVTKRVHHRLHGSAGDGGPLGERERSIYEQTLHHRADTLASLVRPGDPVILNDPQTLGLAPVLSKLGARVIWACHIGADEPNELTNEGWDFLSDYLIGTEAQVFSRLQYAWDGLDPARVSVIPPCIDPFSPKNQPLDEPVVSAVLDAAGIVGEADAPRSFAIVPSQNGGDIAVRRGALVHQEAPLTPNVPVVSQISRWDPLKDHIGLLKAFTEYVPQSYAAHLVLAGPAPSSVDDDPEDGATYDSLTAAWRELPADQRAWVHVIALPMTDPGENAIVVNALQRRSYLVVQKSIAEGFGLTVAEAMIKGRPLVASRVGGIQDQVADRVSGLLVDDPTDLKAFGYDINFLLSDEMLAHRLGRAGVERVMDQYVPPFHLGKYLRLIEQVG